MDFCLIFGTHKSWLSNFLSTCTLDWWIHLDFLLVSFNFVYYRYKVNVRNPHRLCNGHNCCHAGLQNHSYRNNLFLHILQVEIGLTGDEAALVESETSSSSVSSTTTVSTQISGKPRKPPNILQINPPALLVTTSDFSPMSLCSPSLPTASLTPAMLQVRVQPHFSLVVKGISLEITSHFREINVNKAEGVNNQWRH